MRKSNSKALDVIVIIITAILVITATIGLLLSSVWVYFQINKSAGPESHVTSYVSTIKDEKDKERYFMELEYWENADGNGAEVFEFCFNAYSGVDCTTVIQKVAQFWRIPGEEIATTASDISTYAFTNTTAGLADLATILANRTSDTLENNWNANYYDRDGGASFKSVDAVDCSTKQYVTINDKLFSIQMNGTYTTTYKSVNFIKSVGSFFKNLFTDWSAFTKDESWYDVHYESHNYDMLDFYTACLDALVYNNVGYGTNVLSLVDLSKYFTLQDGSSGQFVDIENNQEYAKQYFAVKVTKHREGMRRAGESNALMLNNDADWTLVETDDVYNDYANYDAVINLNEQDFNYRFCPQLGGYVAVLKDKYNDAGYDNTIFDIEINTNNFGSNFTLVGLMSDKTHTYFRDTITVWTSSSNGYFYELTSDKSATGHRVYVHANGESHRISTEVIFI